MNPKIITAVKALDKKKALDIKALKVEDLTIVTEAFVIAAGTSSTHVRSLADEVEYQMKLAGFEPRQIEGKATGWILLDYGTVIVHVFSRQMREYYSLEHLWSAGEKIELEKILKNVREESQN